MSWTHGSTNLLSYSPDVFSKAYSSGYDIRSQQQNNSNGDWYQYCFFCGFLLISGKDSWTSQLLSFQISNIFPVTAIYIPKEVYQYLIESIYHHSRYLLLSRIFLWVYTSLYKISSFGTNEVPLAIPHKYNTNTWNIRIQNTIESKEFLHFMFSNIDIAIGSIQIFVCGKEII